MKGFVFDPSRLRKSPKQLEREGYALAAQLLRDYLNWPDRGRLTGPGSPTDGGQSRGSTDLERRKTTRPSALLR
jgi:hypothetical protein